MAALGNFVWFLFCGGLLTSLLWIMAAGLMAVTVVGIPFAHAALRIANPRPASNPQEFFLGA